MNLQTLEPTTLPHYKRGQPAPYSAGWKLGFTTAWDAATNTWDQTGFDRAETKVAELGTLLAELQGKDKPRDYDTCLESLHWWRGIVDGSKDERHKAGAPLPTGR